MTREELVSQIRQKKSFLCVGLDTDPRKIPQCVFDLHDPVFEFNRAIIDATAPYCVAYKPNLAFYEAYGLKGMESFVKTIRYLRENHPHHLVIADAKRGDIGNTSQMYARTFFEEYDVDALTVAPYMGEDSVTPFLQYPGKWVVLLALTSNKGSHDFQMLPIANLGANASERLNSDALGANASERLNNGGVPTLGGVGSCGEKRVFEEVLERSQQWGSEENMMFVVGATQGRLFEDVRRIVPRHFLLVPGVGAQGGSLEEVCRYGMTADCGLLVNSSRGIIYASTDDNYAEIAGNKARELQQQMATLLGNF